MFERVYVEDAKGMVGETVTIAGWVTRARDLRKIMFIVLRDKSGDIQITVKKDGSNDFADLDLGREDVRIHIGREDFSESMSECALISAGYAVRGRPVGVLGVLGPRRMSYPRVIGTCRYMARLVGGILGRAGL